MDIRDYWHVVRKRWIAIVLITVLGGALALAYSMAATKIYSATAKNFVSVSSQSQLTGNSEVYGGAAFTLQRVKSYVDLVDTPQVLEPVIEELELDTTVTALADSVSAVNPPQTVLLNVTVTGTDPVLIAKTANAVAAEYAKQIAELETPAQSKKARKIAKATSPVKVTATAPALPPTSPISPRTKVNVALGLLLGLGLGLAWAILRDQMDNTVKTPEDLRDLSGSTALGVIGFDPGAQSNPLVALDQTAIRAEAFRTIRTNLQYVDVDNPPRAIAITSAMPTEGKTTTACNLAITLAQSGKSVCLVEGDLRRPKVAEYLGVDSSVGLTNVLAGNAKLDDVLLPWNRDLLTVLPTGPIPPNPSELLSSQQLQHVLADLKERFDVVIIDAAPILPVADGAIVSAAADGAVIIARYGKTTRDQLAKATESLEQVDARVLGVALNFVPIKKRGGYGYGYGYGYQNDAEKDTKKSKHRSRKETKTAGENPAPESGNRKAESSDKGETPTVEPVRQKAEPPSSIEADILP